jgi:hypothetical protein
LRENVEDQLAAIDDAKVEFLFEVAGLRGAERIVEDREGRTSPMRNLFNLGSLALADKGARVGGFELLRDGVGDFGAGGLGESLELRERFLGGNFVARAEFDPDQDRAFDLFERLTISAAQMKTSSQLICCGPGSYQKFPPLSTPPQTYLKPTRRLGILPSQRRAE